jgi:predicted membrane chloride channel (bestrophin family)
MGMPKVRKKPTNKEMASAIIEINNRLHETMGYVQQLDRVIGLYIEMKKDNKEFNEYINKKLEERKNDTKGNETPNKPDIPKDTKDTGSGTEGVREKKE